MLLDRLITRIRKALRPLIVALALASGLLFMQPGLPAYAATFSVTTTADSGPGSLRAAIEAANATAGKDTIRFAIPGGGPHTITLASDLPDITRPVIIDGASQPTFPGMLGIRLNCNANGGLRLAAGSNGSTIKGMAIGGSSGAGIQLVDSMKNTIQGNYLGTFDGINSAPNATGITLYSSSGNLIGGMIPSQGNLISANTSDGVQLSGSATSGNRVQGNRIGTNLYGSLALGNGNGVHVSDAPNNTIGGTTAGAGNLISGNIQPGIVIENTGATGNRVQGNFIGTDATGTLDLGNGEGVRVQYTQSNTIGGTAAGARNVISGNSQYGIIFNSTTGGNLMQGNFIGTDVTGTLPLGNDTAGVQVQDAPGNVIGGTAAGAGNVISGNHGSGIHINSFSVGGSVVSVVQGNFIGTDKTGTVDIGNDMHGVNVLDGPGIIVIGGAIPGAGNVISGNEENGLQISGATPGTLVRGNFIGTDKTGALDLGNTFSGVSVSDTSNTTIGGAEPGEGNRISYNNTAGVYVGTSSGLKIQGNRIEHNDPGPGISFVIASATTNTMNCISENGAGMTNQFGSSTIAEGNWWGDASGPTHATNPGGTGQTVSNDIDFTPWVTTSCEDLLSQRVTNRSMETDSEPNLLPDNWIGSKLTLNATNDGQDCAFGGANSSTCSFRFKGNNKAKSLTQTILLGGGVGEDITLSLYSAETGVPSGGKYKVTVTLYHVTGTKQIKVINLPTGTHGFTVHTAPVLTTTKAYNKIQVKIEFTKKSGKAYVDEVSVLAVP